MKLKLQDSSGRLTSYGLACGYIEQVSLPHGVTISLWSEHGVYHVRVHDFGNHVRKTWESFGSLAEARKTFKRLMQQETGF